MPGRSHVLTSEGERAGRGRYAAIAVAVSVPAAVLLWRASAFLPFLADDALISLRYARRLLDGQGLTWTDGERVEGYSNLLWILLDSGLGALGVDLIVAARILGIVALVVTFACIALLHRGAPLSALLAGVLLALSGPAIVWSIGGLEEPLVAGLFALALVAFVRGEASTSEKNQAGARFQELRAGVPLALLCLTRPDGPLFTLVFAAVRFLRARERRFRSALLLAALPAAAVLAQLGFRLAYYGDWLPNTAYLKARVDLLTLRHGLEYLRAGLAYLWPALLLGAAGALLGGRVPGRRAAVQLLIGSFVAWTAYVAAIGGDIFPAHRHLLLPLVACAFLSSFAFERALALEKPALKVIATLALSAAIVVHAFLQPRDPDVRAARVQRWQWDGEVVGRLFGEGYSAERPLWAVSAAGCLPYFSGLPALDILGLTDRHIARTPPDRSLPLYHDRGDGEYVLERAPDLITFGVPAGGPPTYVTGDELRGDPRFREQYQKVAFEGFEPYRAPSLTFVRREGRVGLRRGGETVLHPGTLLSDAIAQLGPDGTMVGRLSAGADAVSQPLALAPGLWQVRLVPDNPLVTLEAEVALGPGLASDAPGAFELAEPATLVLHLSARWLDTLVEAIELERVGPPREARAEDERHARVTLLRALDEERIRGTEIVGLLEPAAHAETWSASGDAFALVESRWLSSKTEALGERARGSLRSRAFDVPERAWLELTLGGTEGRDFHTRCGVRLGRGERTLQVFSGREGVGPRSVRFDLAPYAGDSLWLEVFDESRIGHVLAGSFVLHQRLP